MSDPREILGQLRDAEWSQRPMRIERDALEVDPVYGFVVSVTDEWVAVQSLDSAVYIDGYEVIRIGDISQVEVDGTRPYIARAVAELGRPQVDFRLPSGATTADVLSAASDHSALVVVHFEQEEGEPLWIGHIDRLDATEFHLLFIDSGGRWESKTWQSEYEDVTRVEFGDRYSLALARFGDARPTS